jgi:hypothetical protein
MLLIDACPSFQDMAFVMNIGRVSRHREKVELYNRAIAPLPVFDIPQI